MSQTFDYSTYLSPFTWRYGSQAMRAIWSEVAYRRLWRRCWIALAEAEAEAGLISPTELADLRAHAEDVDVERAQAIEREIHHDLMAEIRAFAEQAPVGGGKLHLGATSADIEDNADVLRILQSLGVLRVKLLDLLGALADQIMVFDDTVCMAYTHLQPAEPTTVGYRLAQYAQDLLLDLDLLDWTHETLKGKGFKGAVGTSASYERLLEETGATPDDVEQAALRRLGLEAVPVATQVYPRKQDLLALNALASLAQSLHRLAFDVRVLQSGGFGEWSEPFGAQQVGSSAMPFKRNPIASENICSLARYVAALPAVAWSNAALSLLERTLDDSGNRRLILPQAFLASDTLLDRSRRVVAGLRVNRGAIERHLRTFGSFAATEALLMRLVRRGGDRQALHEAIRACCMRAWEALEAGQANPLPALLADHPAIRALMAPDEVAAALDYRAHTGLAQRRCGQMVQLIRERLGVSERGPSVVELHPRRGAPC